MKFTLSWLIEHLQTDAPLERIVETLTLVGLEVEELHDPAAAFAGVEVAEIIDAAPHPADGDEANAHVAGPSALRRVEIARFGQRFGPQLLDIVKIPNFRPEEMHDDVTGIDQDPIAILSAFDGNALNTSRLKPLTQVFRHRPNLTDTGATRHDHGVGNRALTGQVDIDDIDRLVIIERLQDQFE
mgnify:CR=1 FL=1